MKTFSRLTVISGLLMLALGIPAVAQIANGVDFKTSFPFYAGNAKMPAGEYTITQVTGEFGDELQIQSKSGTHSAYLDITVINGTNPHQKTSIAFNKYGTTEYLSQVWVAGQQNGMQIEATKVEQKTAAKTPPVQHSAPATAK